MHSVLRWLCVALILGSLAPAKVLSGAISLVLPGELFFAVVSPNESEPQGDANARLEEAPASTAVRLVLPGTLSSFGALRETDPTSSKRTGGAVSGWYAAATQDGFPQVLDLACAPAADPQFAGRNLPLQI